jgi:creatinine amidohydrolase
MVEIKSQFDPSLRNILKNKKQVAVIPVGSIEQHGPHLPISTDSDIVTRQHFNEYFWICVSLFTKIK